MAFLSSTSNWLKKHYFNGAHFLDAISQHQLQGAIYLFGINFTPQQSGEQAIQNANQLYQSVLWFTYREGIKFAHCPSVTSDVGWGCMLRVGQMMVAQALRIHAGPEFYADQAYLKQLVREFLEPNGTFSLEMIAEVGEEKVEKKPGQWYSPADISFVLLEIMKNFSAKHFKKSNKFIKQPIEMRVLNAEFSLNDIYHSLRLTSSNSIHPCLIVILIRVGYQKAENQLLDSVITIIKEEPHFVGILGGRPGKAHYIFGASDHSFIYLDPHCVKDQLEVESFFCPQFFSMPMEKIDPSMGVCFYVRKTEELFRLHERLKRLGKSSPIYCEEQKEIGMLQLDEEEQFQILQ